MTAYSLKKFYGLLRNRFNRHVVYPCYRSLFKRNLLPNRNRAYRLEGRWVYLNIAESKAMVKRRLGLYHRDLHRAIRGALSSGMTFIDIGANKGDFCLLAASVLGPSGRVLAFEPEPENCHWLRKSINANSYHNIELHQVALGDVDEEATLYLANRSGHHSLLPGPNRQVGQIVVHKRRLDSVLDAFHVGHVDAIKIDVEGAEMQVLRGAQETLGRNPDIVLFIDLHQSLGVDPDEVRDFLRDRGFFLAKVSSPDKELSDLGMKNLKILAKRR